MLVEAKAHDYELRKEENGKKLSKNCSNSSRINHEHIAAAIGSANASLSEETKMTWSLSRDSRYQMSNRFAWAWKVTELGMPVILVYLGFIGCEEMREGKRQRPIASHAEWAGMVKEHSRPLFQGKVWDREWHVNGQLLIPVIRTTDQSLTGL
jgi:hypothetical protein